MRPLWKLTVTELKLFLREPAAVFFTLAFPLLLLWLNSGDGNQPRDGLATASYGDDRSHARGGGVWGGAPMRRGRAAA